MRRLLPVLWLWALLPTAALAQASEDTLENVLFLVPRDLDGETMASLRDALLAQFATSDTVLTMDVETDPEAGLSKRLAEARTLMRKEGTAAMFWIRSDEEDQWLVHMLDPEGERVIVRRVDVSGDQRSAGIEAVAVMVRQSTAALLQGRFVGAKVVPGTPPPPPPTPPPPPERERRLRLGAAYHGADFSAQTGWQHGLALSGSWAVFPWLRVGGQYVAVASADAGGAVPFEVTRHPLSVLAAYRQEEVPGLALEGELALGADLLIRHTPPRSQVEPEPDSARWTLVLTPRFRAELPVLPALALHVGAGLDILLNNFKYVSQDGEIATALEPRRLRLMVEAGVAVYP